MRHSPAPKVARDSWAFVSRSGFETALSMRAAGVDKALDERLGGGAEARLADAMRHALLAGGKRLRPFVLLTAAGLFGVDDARAMPAACALECVHAFSLVHDDLPALDDDDLRRGRPTVHRAFDEATAVLAGDALLTIAFEILADETTHPAPHVRAELVTALARAVGPLGMIGGQMRDLAAEGRFVAGGKPLVLDEADTLTLQEMKTAALFRFAAEAGAILGEAGADDRARMRGFGRALGLAFQIADDLLDEEASPEELGKATAKDRARGKATLIAALGPEGARRKLNGLVAEAIASLEVYGDRAELLTAAASFAATRRR